MGIKIPEWFKKKNLNCNETLFEFEMSRGPRILGKDYLLIGYTSKLFKTIVFLSGAKRDSGGIRYLVMFDDKKDTTVLTSADARQYEFRVIDFLQSKIEWVDSAETTRTTSAVLVEPRNTASKVICMLQKCIPIEINSTHLHRNFSDATKGPKGLKYFFEYKNGDLAVMSAEDAIVLHSPLVLKYLEEHIA